MPRGSGRPDLSQRPRREAPGMLTGLAILERELGSIEYQRVLVEAELRQRSGRAGRAEPDDTESWKAKARELETRRRLVLEKLAELHEQWDERPTPDAGARIRARSVTRSAERARDAGGYTVRDARKPRAA